MSPDIVTSATDILLCTMGIGIAGTIGAVIMDGPKRMKILFFCLLETLAYWLYLLAFSALIHR